MSLEATNNQNATPQPGEEAPRPAAEPGTPLPSAETEPAGIPAAPAEIPAPPAADAPEEPEDFDSMIGSYLDNIVQHERDSFITVTVVRVHKDVVLVDMGDKAEGMIDIQEFLDARGKVRVVEGQEIEVQVLGRDDETGLIQVSYKQAHVRGAIRRLEEAFRQKKVLTGTVASAVKSGLLVDLGIDCFMPASQVADHRVQNLEEWVGKEIEVEIIEFNPERRKIILSRRKVVEDRKREAMAEALGKVQIGETVQGKVKSVLNFGAFLDVGGLDAYLPREEISWDRAAQPAAVLQPGTLEEVKVLNIDRKTGRVRVSRKALRQDPWLAVDERHPVGAQVSGEVVSITRFGAFVRIEEGLTGLIHATDLVWGKSNARIADHVKEGDTVRAVVLALDLEKRRMALGLKQLAEDPWEEAERLFPRGTKVKGVVTNLATFGAFVKLSDEIEGLIHISDLDWEGKIQHPGEVLQAGQEVEALVLKSDRITRRISLGLKQLTESPMQHWLRDHPEGSNIEGEVVRMMPMGAFLNLAPGIDGFLHVSQMAVDRVDKPEAAVKIGERILCKIIKIEKGKGGAKVNLSRKMLLIAEERKAIRQYEADPKDKGGMKLGDLMGAIKLGPVPAAPAETAAPEVAAPEVAAPEIALPEVAAPEVAAPEIAAPEVAAPESATPEIAVPEDAAPETAAVETAPAEVAAPEVAAPEVAAPEVAAPEIPTSEAAAPVSEPMPEAPSAPEKPEAETAEAAPPEEPGRV